MKRPNRPAGDEVRVHYGTILSGGTVVKSAIYRDQLSKLHHNALYSEMEAAGTIGSLPCLVIRGTSDYADSHKNDEWQGFAAATAAAYAREVLLRLSERLVQRQVSSTASHGSVKRCNRC